MEKGDSVPHDRLVFGKAVGDQPAMPDHQAGFPQIGLGQELFDVVIGPGNLVPAL